jgi:hypothetical protein
MEGKCQSGQQFQPVFVVRRLSPQRALAAFLAIAFRLAEVSLAARALPPFKPPRRPSATAAGFLSGSTGGSSVIGFPVARLVSRFAMLERLGMADYGMVRYRCLEESGDQFT